MGTQVGAIQIRGTVGGLVFRSDGAVSTKPASRKITAVRTLENNTEFGRAGSYGKALRTAFRSAIGNIATRDMVGRLTSKMNAVIKLDSVSDRGQRVFDAGNSAPLVGFDFGAASLSQTFFAPHTVAQNGANIVLDIPSLDPRTDISAPQGATHYELVLETASLDMELLLSDNGAVASPLGIQPLNGAATSAVSMTAAFAAAPAAANLVVGAVGIRFYQQVNGKNYPLNNGASNALTIEFVA